MAKSPPGHPDRPLPTEPLPSVQLEGGRDPQGWNDLLQRLRQRLRASDRYAGAEEIARGGMGAILRVRDEDLNRALAMKVIVANDPQAPRSEHGSRPTPTLVDPDLLSRFLEEAQVTAQLDHPGVAPVHELGIDADGRVYFTMKLVRGENLRAILHRLGSGEWSTARVLSLLLRACEAVAYAHAKGVVHRDLKPANIMVGRFGETYVMDWGLAKVLDEAERVPNGGGPVGTLTAPIKILKTPPREREPAADTARGEVLGTPCYMAPEQAFGKSGAIGPPTDVYAMGAILYHLLAGHPPYLGSTDASEPHAVLAAVRAGPPAALLDENSDVDPELAAICDKAMARAAHERYRTMSELAEDLRAYLEGRVVRAHRTGPVAEFNKWVARHKATALTSIAALALLCGLGAYAFRSIHVERDRALRNQRAAETNAAQAREAKERVLRLSDLKRLDELTAEMDELWPPVPERIPDLEAWLERARALLKNRPAHQRDRQQLEAQQPAGLETGWWQETLGALVTRLDQFAASDPFGPTVASVERRLAFARTVAKLTLEDPEREWQQAIAGAADQSSAGRYGGIALAPQLGLVPLGRDPESGLQEFWHLQSGERPRRGADGRIQPAEDMGIVLVLVPGEAGPPFFLSKYELTQGQWKRLSGSNPSLHDPSEVVGGRRHTLTHPVEQVSYDQAVRVLARCGLELPSEAQWEHACRAGTAAPWFTGPDARSFSGAGNLADRYSREHGGSPGWRYDDFLDDGYVATAPVGTFRQNAFGLFDTIGNVAEWCSDGDGKADPAARSRAAPGGERPALRAHRGGSFQDSTDSASAASRTLCPADRRLDSLGVRPARRVDPPRP